MNYSDKLAKYHSLDKALTVFASVITRNEWSKEDRDVLNNAYDVVCAKWRRLDDELMED